MRNDTWPWLIAPRLIRGILMLNWPMYSQSFLRIVNTFFPFCHQTVTTYDQSCRQCSWLSNISNVLTRTNCNNKVHSLKFSMVDSSLILDFSLQEVARSCSGLERRCTHCCMEIAGVGTGAGATHMRAVGVDELGAGGTWMWAGARSAPAAGAAVCADWPEPRRPARALPVFGRARAPLPLPGWCAPARGAGRRQHLPGLQTLIFPAE